MTWICAASVIVNSEMTNQRKGGRRSAAYGSWRAAINRAAPSSIGSDGDETICRVQPEPAGRARDERQRPDGLQRATISDRDLSPKESARSRARPATSYGTGPRWR